MFKRVYNLQEVHFSDLVLPALIRVLPALINYHRL